MKHFGYKLDRQGPLVLTGAPDGLSIEDVVAVARFRRRVQLAPQAEKKIERCRKLVDLLKDQKVYGLTTGFGKLRDVLIDQDKTEQLQQNLIMSHAAGIGDPFPEDVVRAAILLRANTLCRGHSGVRVEVVQQLINLLNDDIYPHVPQQGSVGASGDLAPLSHLALVLMGHPKGRFFPRPPIPGAAQPLVSEPRDSDFKYFPGPTSYSDVARQQGWGSFEPITLLAKEGLAVNNGTQFMAAMGCLAVYDCYFTLRMSEMIGAMSLEANRGVLDAFDDRIHEARRLPHQLEVARRVRAYCTESQILSLYLNSAYLFRAGKSLEEAEEHIGWVISELMENGREPPWPVKQLNQDLRRLRQELLQLTDEEGAGIRLHEISALSPREQITRLNDYLLDVRREASMLLNSVSERMFPQTESHPKLQGALAKTVAHLQNVVPTQPLVQDDYSFRCFPQVLACAFRALEHVAQIIEIEVNSATDNPLLFPPEQPEGMSDEAYDASLRDSRETLAKTCVLGGGNFHGQPIASAMDYLSITMAEVGSISERRIAHLVDDNHSSGLPGFLVLDRGLNSGFMIPQYSAAALVSENKSLCYPASVDSIPTCANTEDHVSMGTISARQTIEVVKNVRRVISIELLASYQGLLFRKPLLPGARLRKALETMTRRGVRSLDQDEVMATRMAAAELLLWDTELLDCLV